MELNAGRITVDGIDMRGTTLVIAHRLATLHRADRIVMVDETGVAEQGRHGELIAAGGAYRRLHKAQHGA